MASFKHTMHAMRLCVLGSIIAALVAPVQPGRFLVAAGEQVVRALVSVIGAAVLELFMRLDREGHHLASIASMATTSSCPDLTVRVTRGVGSRGYGAVRVTAICRAPLGTEAEEASLGRCPAVSSERRPLVRRRPRKFDECGRFRSRWTEFHSSSVVAQVQPGRRQRLTFEHLGGPLQVDVRLPSRESGAHGIVIGDPCTSSRYIPGLCNANFDVKSRLPQLLNAINERDPLDFIVLLGDAFYDVHGLLTASFWRRLSKKTQQTFLLSVPGNHDFWIFSPNLMISQDQLGIGFRQWYAQDTAADAHRDSGHANETGAAVDVAPQMPGAREFFFYHIIGDIGFLGFSGAHSLEDHTPLLEEACRHFEAEDANLVYVLGHWNAPDLGCEPGMDVPSLVDHLRKGPCHAVASRMYYMMGHAHCNEAMPDGRGFLLGAGGAAHGSCGDWGIAYLDSRPQASPTRTSASGGFMQSHAAAQHVLAKVTLASETEDHFPPLMSCISAKRSLRSCLDGHAADIWVNSTATHG